MKKQGTVYTFYSFKGGVGRSMALANAACVLAKQGYRVLIIDWDLEAPGIEKYFTQYIQPSARELYGIVDLVDAWAHNETISWESNLLYATPFPNGESVAILTAGKSSANYIGKLQQINWPNLFQEKKFGNYLEQLRTEWVENFDFVLVDSRTGITDIGGICTIHLPDTLVMFFSANEQSLAGVLDVMNRIWESHKALPLDRSKLLCLPVPGRFENFTEYKLATKWKNIFAERLAPLYKDWLPDNTTPHQILEKLFIPYIPYWSFGEGLPVVEEGSTDPRTLGFAYDLLARLLANRLQWNDSLSPEISITHELSGPRLNEWAEAFYNKYDDHEKEIVKNIFLKLINVTTNSKLSLTAAHFNEMERSLLDRLLAEAVLQKRANSLTKETLFEISSESLITSWERLKSWIDENREFLAWRQDLSKRIEIWEENDRDKTELLAAAQLRKALRIKELRIRDLGDLEVVYIEASRKEERNKVRRKYLLYGGIIYAIIVVVAIVVYLGYKINYQTNRQEELIKHQARTLDSLAYTLKSSRSEPSAPANLVFEERELRSNREGFNKYGHGLFLKNSSLGTAIVDQYTIYTATTCIEINSDASAQLLLKQLGLNDSSLLYSFIDGNVLATDRSVTLFSTSTNNNKDRSKIEKALKLLFIRIRYHDLTGVKYEIGWGKKEYYKEDKCK